VGAVLSPGIATPVISDSDNTPDVTSGLDHTTPALEIDADVSVSRDFFILSLPVQCTPRYY
jgi:hypothetical protein